MDDEIRMRIDRQDQMLSAIFRSTEKTRKYFLWTMILTIVTLVLPLVGLVFALPALMNMIGPALGTLQSIGY